MKIELKQCVFAESGTLRIASIHGYLDQDWNNAEFIVRSCNAHEDLLNSLKWIVEFCSEHEEWFGCGTQYDGAEFEWLDNARKIIAKAEAS